MPRSRQFDEQDVVARATELFHRRGYHATSTRDLGDALALNPSSLYRTFGDKHALFLRALDHYQASESARCTAALDDDGPVRAVLRDWLHSMVEPSDVPGCFVINTATELGTEDPEAARRVDAAFEGTTAAIAKLLRRGITSGELPADLDADGTADLLFTTLAGLRVRHRAGHDPQRLRAAVDQALRVLG
ncbi:TetR/AcrR family transcriptional regulator [Amycolatopsis thermophila]|uniref:TetR/AcrR family transcriptional repressor of nem operon n=1 Tax=Amycolatopsis thermophila TaxID=206084 RepID=A0ABU0F6C9_9PSEU|nr:TetR/AcrR family transcriptional regulator [Amycolatopsis thermophila]MDQ0382943.1 TetR/AcrR family transcriptional repressor of nem operon [Amycolatopsis thermophila]